MSGIVKSRKASAVTADDGKGGALFGQLQQAMDRIDWSQQAAGGVNVLRWVPPDKWPGILAKATTYDATAAIQSAFNAGGVVWMPEGLFLVSAPITRTASGMQVRGAGVDSTIVEPVAGFVGSAVFILGNKNAPGECRHIGMSSLMIDLKARVDAGIEFYGLRDGSFFRSVYVWKIRKYGIRSGWTNAGVGAPDTMSQGVELTNCHVLSRNDGGTINDGAYFDLSGLYESTLIGCKALGYSAASVTQTNTVGFLIGGVSKTGLTKTDCSAVRLYNCSTGNLFGSGNVGVFFGNAFYCSADGHTSENIEGTDFYWGRKVTSGTAADVYSAAYCVANMPRIYNPAASPTVAAVNFHFDAAASQCKAINVPRVSSIAGQKVARFTGTAAMCGVEVIGANFAAASVGDFVDFVSTNLSNSVKLMTGDTATKNAVTVARDQYQVERLANGTVIEVTQFYTQYKLADPIRFSKADGTQILTVTETGAVIFNKAQLPTSAVGSAGQVWMDAAAGNALKVI